MTFGAEIWGPALIGATGSIGNGLLGGSGVAKETKMEKKKRNLIDQLLSSLNGEGPYSDLYNTDQNSFNKSFVEPAQSMYRNQIAPQIQQQFISSGQQRGTGLDDSLTRAGIDLNSILNKHLFDFQQGGLDRKQNTINSILGGGSGAPQQPSSSDVFNSSLSGYLSSDAFKDLSQQPFKKLPMQRKGFENDASYAAQAPYLYGGN